MSELDEILANVEAESAARWTETHPTQLTKDDVSQMYADRQYSQIEQARQDGRLTEMLSPPEGA